MKFRIEVETNKGYRVWIARITGTYIRYGLRRSFIPADVYSRNRKYQTVNQVWELGSGLYELIRTKKNNEFFILYHYDGGLAKKTIDMARVKAIARLLDAGEDFESARLATKSGA